MRSVDTTAIGREPTTSTLTADERPIVRVLGDVLAYARERDYRGWDYGDGMSSRLLRALPVDNKWLNLAVQEIVKRPPVNLRPLFLVEQRRNYKGAALFSMANLGAHRLTADGERGGDRDPDYRQEALDLADWLIDTRSVGYAGFCAGHKHEIQHLDGRGQPNDPDVVSTSYAVKALLAASRYEEGDGSRYERVARSAADFVVEDLDYREVEGGARIDYHLNHPDDYYTINSGALGARLFLDLYDHFDDAEYLERARGLLDHIADLQRDPGGWTYREPADASHLSMDNHHNGFVIESFLRHEAVAGGGRYGDTLDRALSFYRDELFDPNGAPNFDEENAYPRDVHASAQGILVFAYAGDVEFAERILSWTLEHMYVPEESRFHFRKHRLYTNRTTLMRWCQAWMAYAMAEYLAAAGSADATTGHEIANPG